MARKDIKLDEGIRNISFDVKTSDISVFSDRVDVPVIRYGNNFEVSSIGRETRIKEIDNMEDSSITITGNGNCNIRIGNNCIINRGINNGTIICGKGVTIVNGVSYGSYNDGNTLNGEYSSVELVLPKRYEDFSINVQSKTGNFIMEDTILAKLIANTMSGNIALKDIDAMFMKLKTMSGNIKAEILESIINYRTTLKTMSGSTNQNSVETVSPSILEIKRELEANTMSGNISLTFKGKR